MSKALVIVESPAKTKTLKNFLGPEYDVQASMGHVRDLPKSTLGVDIEHDFRPRYVVIPERKEVIQKLQQAAAKAETVYLASDPDREGEAIAWHLCELLKLRNPRRLRFNEITKTAVLEGLKNSDDIDFNLVNAQQARRVLDRLVGYMLSPLLWRKVKRNLSAGRVQSVAVRLICDREREIEAFVPEEYWTITATLTPRPRRQPFDAKLVQRDDEKVKISNEEEAHSILKELEGAQYVVKSVKKTQKRRNPAPPFITSTLQQEASRKLGFAAKRTMLVAQQLYEGIELGPEGAVGLITYMRTDSTRVAAEAQAEARQYIEETFGKDYLPASARQVTRKGAQDAHEAIRPTSVYRHPDQIKQYLTADQYKLYRLVWQRFVASQMAAAVFDVVTVDISANNFVFRATGSTVRFPGFMRVYIEGKDDTAAVADEEQPPLPEMHEGEVLDLIKLLPEQHFTEPPPRYTEATLVKALEEKGIGRPSTYAQIISTIQERKYVELVDKKFRPTELGFIVTDQLVKYFPDIMDVEFTAGVESKLDKVEEGTLDWVELLREFYGPFERDVHAALENMEKVKIAPKESDEICPNCGRKMVIRESRYGEFLGCSGYPECKTTKPLNNSINVKCPVCGEGDIIERRSRKGRVFYGCSRYPECSFVSWNKPTDKHCPKCGGLLGERRFRNRLIGYRCTTQGCDYETKTISSDRETSGDTQPPTNGDAKASPEALEVFDEEITRAAM
ncbi:MAG: type I DNA topoisomerase [Armatimonadota bacterium]|nr:type I DNA topoisomerase [Armatimonadota bacterium]